MSRVQSDFEATRVGAIGERIVEAYLKENGWEVTKRKDVEGDNTGFDFLAKKDEETRYIEVKSTKYEFKVPDLHETEFMGDPTEGRMKATHLYVVGNIRKDMAPVLNVLPTSVIKNKVDDGTIVVKTKTVIKGNRFNKLGEFAEQIKLDVDLNDYT
jgi:hypothetical protein